MSTSNTDIRTVAGPAAGTPAGGFRVQLVWQAVRRHPIAVLVLVLLAGAAAGGAWFFLPVSKRTGVTVFHVAAQPPSLLTAQAENKVEFNTYKNMQAALVKQRLVLNEALKHPDAKDLQMLRGKADLLAFLEQKLQVDFKVGPEFMRVTIEGDDEAELQKLLAAVSTAYLAEVNKKENGVRNFRRDELDKRRRKYEEMLLGYQQRLTQLAKALQSTNPAVLTVMEELAKGRLQHLQHDILINEQELVRAEREFQFHKEKADQAKDGAVPDAAIERGVRADAGLAEYERAVAQKRTQFEGLDKDLVDKSHPRLLQARQAWEAAAADLERYKEGLRPKAAAAAKEQLGLDHAQAAARNAERAEALRKTKQALDEAFESIKREIGEKSVVYLDLERVRQDIARTDKLHDQIVHELDQLDIDRGVPLRVTVSEAPYVMAGLEGNKRMKMALITGSAAFVLGLAGLVFWESRNRRVLGADDLGKGLGLKVFGTVPAIRPDAGASPNGEMALTEAIDTARTMLLYAAYGGRPPRTVLVTSALPGEGKTSLSGHLAISLTRAGYKTLLIDADLRNPSNHRVFDLPDGPGLSEYLRGETDQAAAVRPTPFPGLRVLPAGRWSLAATQALAGGRWAALRAAVEAEYDFVVIDSAPILPVVDSLLLARNVDGVILSVRNEYSTVASVAETQYRLLSTGANVLGVVLNGIGPRGGGRGYAYRPAARAAEPLVSTPA